ncbi:MAG: GNAT family N-acetyltransferase [Candidatus Limnocylindrales bacterium]
MTSATPSSTSADPACTVVARPVAFEAIARATWDALLARTLRATPFSRWTWHRAWWDAYGTEARPAYVACEDDQGTLRAIVPLMERQGLVFMGASYHGDYATILGDPSDLPAAAAAVAAGLAGQPVDLRRLRHDDPALPALEVALGLPREQEDVCPTVTVDAGLDWEGYLGSLDKKDRHEIRRKVRRAESTAAARFEMVEPTPEAVETFMRLHDARWGELGLFPATPAGDRSRTFVRRLAELEAAEGPGRQLQLGQYTVGERLIFASVGFHDADTCYFYNAGMDPAARDLSPGVTGAAAYLRYELEHDCRRFDFLRGSEPYKYEWGARDVPIFRLTGRVEAAR